MADDEQAQVLFRASKRRKVLRKPNQRDGSEEATSPLTEEMGMAITKHEDEDEENVDSGVTRVQRKGGVKKLGIGFSSSETGRNVERAISEEQALVAADENGVSEPPKIDRFVKPTGKVGVTEDRHMMAYVDSKLADKRLVTEIPITSTKGQFDSDAPGMDGGVDTNVRTLEARSPAASTHQKSDNRTYQSAQERSRSVYQRPTKRKPPPPRPQTDVVRDSVIEQIMGESQVPHYDHSVTETHREDGEDVDNDAAAAEAFKAQLLADLERNKRRPPLSKSTATTSTGPKLGGSRSQREKMRAMEEAKGSSSKK